jgi:hypothetical protein
MNRSLRTLVFAVLASSGILGVVAACSTGTTGGSDGGGASDCSELSTTCPGTPPSWQTDVEPLIATYCLTCHSDGGVAPATFDYTSYAGVYKNRAEMLSQVYDCVMPLIDASPAAAQPSAADRQTIVSWLVCGAPDN